MPRKHLIEIKRDPATLELVYEHSDDIDGVIREVAGDVAIRVNSGDRVGWKCDLGNFCVLFGTDESPFVGGETVIGRSKGQLSSRGVVKRLFAAPPAPGTLPQLTEFKYTVAIMEGGGMVPATVEDPLLEVEDTGGGN